MRFRAIKCAYVRGCVLLFGVVWCCALVCALLCCGCVVLCCGVVVSCGVMLCVDV